MNYQTFTPTATLSRYVKSYWTLESSDENHTASSEKVFPDGCIELMFHYGDRFREYKPGHEAELQPRSFIYGQIEKFIEIEATGKIGILGIRFHPNGLRPFVKFDVNELTGQAVEIRDLWGKDGEILEDGILNACSNEKRIALFEIFLLRRLKEFSETDPVIERCVDSILRSDGNIAIDDLAYQLNIGRRHLERKFISNVGIRPKLLSRITRFRNTLNLIEHKQFTSLTMVAYEGGFYDQAHFIRDFKEFTGLNPKQYFSYDLDLAKYFYLD
jgi:AraC-like DNA-binding protein